MIAQLFSVVAPVLVTAGIGFFWARRGRPFDMDLVTTLVTLVGAPCLVFQTLATLSVGAHAFLDIVGAAMAVMAACAAAGWGVLRLAGLSQRAFLPALIFGNTGNMGLPLSYLAFGNEGLGLAVGIFALYAVGQFTAGVAIASGRMSPGDLARMPILWALVPALAFLFAGVRPPDWITATTKLIGDMTVPLMLITLGISLGRLAVRSLPRSLMLAALRLLMGFGAGLAAAHLFDLTGAANGVLIVQSAMPVAVFNYLFAQRYGTAPEEVAGAVVISTALSFATLPALLWFVL